MILKLSMNYYKLTIIVNALLLLGISNNALSQQSSKYKLLEVPKNNQIEIDQYGYFYIIDQPKMNDRHRRYLWVIDLFQIPNYLFHHFVFFLGCHLLFPVDSSFASSLLNTTRLPLLYAWPII